MIEAGCRRDAKTRLDQSVVVPGGLADLGPGSAQSRGVPEASGHLADSHWAFSCPPRRSLAGRVQAGSVALGEPVQSPRVGRSGAPGSRRASLGLSLPRSRSGLSGKFRGARPTRSDPHRPTDAPSTLPSYGQESFARLPLSLAAPASLAEVRPPASSRQSQPGEPGGLQENSPGSSRKR
jgi:hypothetical protein